MVNKSQKYQGILREPMPVNPTDRDIYSRIDAYIDYLGISREQSTLKQYQAVLKEFIKQANVIIEQENKKYKDKRLPIAKIKTLDDVCNFIKFQRGAIDSTIHILTVQYHIYKPPTVTEKKIFELSYIIPKLANKLKIPAFMPTNIYSLMYSDVLDAKNFIMYRDILYLRRVHGLTYNKAILKYLKDNNIKYDTEDEDKIESVKRVIRRLKKTNKRIKKYYSEEYNRTIFEILKKYKFIPQEVTFKKDLIKEVAEQAFIMSAQKNSYDDYVKYGKKKLKGLKNYELFETVQTYCYNAFASLI